MPLDPVLVLVVEDGQAGLVKELLEALNRQATLVLHLLQLAGLQALKVVRLRLARFSGPRPEGQSGRDVGGGNPFVPVGPEPAVHVDRLQVLRVAALLSKWQFYQHKFNGKNNVIDLRLTVRSKVGRFFN